MAYGELGPTHHSIEDLSWLRAIDGLGIVVPADPAQTSAAVRWAAKSATPCYIRVGRTKVPAVTPEGADAFAFGARRRVAQRRGPVVGGDRERWSRGRSPRRTLSPNRA